MECYLKGRAMPGGISAGVSDLSDYVLLASGSPADLGNRPGAPVLRTKKPDSLGLYLVALADGRMMWTRSENPGTVQSSASDGPPGRRSPPLAPLPPGVVPCPTPSPRPA